MKAGHDCSDRHAGYLGDFAAELQVACGMSARLFDVKSSIARVLSLKDAGVASFLIE